MIQTTWVNIIKPEAAAIVIKELPPTKPKRFRRKSTVSPFSASKRELVEVIKANPFIKPKAACRILGWSASKMTGVLAYYKDEIGCGLNLKGKA